MHNWKFRNFLNKNHPNTHSHPMTDIVLYQSRIPRGLWLNLKFRIDSLETFSNLHQFWRGRLKASIYSSLPHPDGGSAAAAASIHYWAGRTLQCSLGGKEIVDILSWAGGRPLACHAKERRPKQSTWIGIWQDITIKRVVFFWALPKLARTPTPSPPIWRNKVPMMIMIVEMSTLFYSVSKYRK